MVRLIIQDQDVPLAANLASKQSLHQPCVALDVTRLLDHHFRFLRTAVLEYLHSLRDRDLECSLGHVTAAATSRGLGADFDGCLDDLLHPVFLHLRTSTHTLALELVPVLYQHTSTPQVRQQIGRN